MLNNSFLAHLVKQKLLTEKAAKKAAEKAQQQNISVITYCLDNQLLPHTKMAQQIAAFFHLPFVDLAAYQAENLPISCIAKQYLQQHRILPLKQEDNKLLVAIANPIHTNILNELAFRTSFDITPAIVEQDKLNDLREQALYNKRYHYLENNDKRVINFVAKLLAEAAQKNASDIHIEPCGKEYRIRLRIDGILHTVTTVETDFAKQLVARIKILAELDIAEKRLPQDGRFTSNKRDWRISTCPTISGEKVVARLLNTNDSVLQLSDLGLEPAQTQTLLQAISKPQGLILVTGPTGSGKTGTLYAMLNMLNNTAKNIVTIEDPVEINLAGINQVNINPKINFSFAKALRTFLRQDPDAIMLGEIRDLETAENAIRASQTGHLVLSTLHTNSAALSITRLLNMGITGFNITSALTLIIAQRLVRKICAACQGSSCDNCQQGFKGRIGVFEVMPITPSLQQMIIDHKSATNIEQTAQQEGIINLQQAALNKVKQSITTIEEVRRVI